MTTVADELEAIRQLKARYCRFLDTKDLASWRDVFTADLVVTLDMAVSTAGADPQTAPPIEGVDNFAPMVMGGLEGSLKMSVAPGFSTYIPVRGAISRASNTPTASPRKFSRSGSITPPRWLRRRCWFIRRATPGTTVATCPARSGCTWVIPAGFPNIGAAATKSRPAVTSVSNSRSWRR